MLPRFLLISLLALAPNAVFAQANGEAAPYDSQLMRLSEVLGSLHFLRRLCNPDEGAVWRNAMGSLLAAERPVAERAQRMTARFNRGFGTFSRSYARCTPAAIRAAELYQAEGARISSQVVSRYAR